MRNKKRETGREETDDRVKREREERVRERERRKEKRREVGGPGGVLANCS